MESRQDTTNIPCPGCGKPVDPLRAPAVSVVEGRITHFCTSDCREKYLKRSVSHKKDDTPTKPSSPKSPTDPDSNKKQEQKQTTIELSASHQPGQYRSKLLSNQLIQLAVLTLVATLAALVPPIAGGLIPVIIVSVALITIFAFIAWRERRTGLHKIAEAMAIPIASGAVLACSFLGLSSRLSAVSAAMILVAESFGRLIELIGRRRSGVLDTVEGDTQFAVPNSWRDNSEMAAKVKTLAIALGWARYPVSLTVGLATFFLSPASAMDAILASAAALLAINPRTLRMATGDAHLSAALWASANEITIRDAHAIQRLALSETVLFIAKRALLEAQHKVVDWTVSETANERTAINALHAAEMNATGTIASAIQTFTASQKADASSPCPVEKVPNLGITSDTPYGHVMCGSRALLLDNGISTALLEGAAETIESSGRRAVFLSLNDKSVAVFGIEDKPVPNTKETSNRLKHMGIEPALSVVSDVNAAQSLGARINIDTVYFNTPDEALNRVLEKLSAANARVALVGAGPPFEENLRAANVGIAFGSAGATQAGINIRTQEILVIPWLVGIARRAHLSIKFNLTTAIGSMLFGLGFAASWFSPLVVLTVGTAGFAVAAGSTWNAPYPILENLHKQLNGLVERAKNLIGRKHIRRR